MVCDGINDSPALAQVDFVIVLGNGTEIAVETAGMVFMKANLFDVIPAIHLFRTICARIRLNYVWALCYNCLLTLLAPGVLYPYGFTIPLMFAGGTGATHWTTSVELLSPKAVLVVPRYLYANVQRKVNNKRQSSCW
uniref:Cation-transporting P-type ATPase C-terminal domain-containing protein n=1 Tax=Hyaloperonospora arabidopsidis (strain Emoy2) TaxID=559515 RepID=M4B923_HYAAE